MAGGTILKEMIYRALRQQSKLATCASERETNGLLVEMVTGYSPQVSDEN